MTGLYLIRCVLLLATSFPDGPVGVWEFPSCQLSGEVSAVDTGQVFVLPTIYTVYSSGTILADFEVFSAEDI